jgi:DNA-binding MarR family transcriptional regulator
MNITLIKETLDLLELFCQQQEQTNGYSYTAEGFRQWIIDQSVSSQTAFDWEGKTNGRSEDSIISTLFVHMNRYAKNYSKAAMLHSDFSTQEEFIFLIILKSFGEMSKMELIKRNVHEKPTGMKLIDRLLENGWVTQRHSPTDGRSKLIQISPKGLDMLETHMDKIRQASKVVTGRLTSQEKTTLIGLLQKLAVFHDSIYQAQIPPSHLLEYALKEQSQ